MLKNLIVDALGRGGEKVSASSVQILPLSSCLRDHGNDLVMIFYGRERQPRWVYKVPRTPHFNFKIENEHGALLAAANSTELISRVPLAVGAGFIGDQRYLIQHAVNGTALSSKLLACSKLEPCEALLLKGVALLGPLHQIAASGMPNSVNWNSSASLDLEGTRELGLDFGPGGLDVLGAPFAKLIALTLERGRNWFCHGDFWQTNILLTDGEVSGLIDWEFATAEGPAPTDLGWYLINGAYYLCMRDNEHMQMQDAFKHCFFDGDTTSESKETPDEIRAILRRVAKAGAEALQLPLEQIDTLLLATLAQLSQREWSAYGHHGQMDGICGEMLSHALRHPESFGLGLK